MVLFQKQALHYCSETATVSFLSLQDLTDIPAYHMWTLVGVYNYILYTGDSAFLNRNWANYTRALDFVLRKINDRGLMNVSGNRDWARLNQGGENTEANIL
jgi:hypothetical protein